MSCGFLIVTCSIGTRHNRCSAMGGCVAKEGRRSHAPTNDQQIEYELRVPRSGTYIMKPTASCEAAQLWVRATPPPKYSSPEGDLHILYDIEDDSRSRFAEPREGEGMLIPQLRSFGACSGFLTITCPLGTRRWSRSEIILV